MSLDFDIHANSNLKTALDVLNNNPPIVGSSFEIWYNRWPQAKWMAQGITAPGLKTNTVDIHFSGFHVPVIINTTYDETELSMDILADENGVYYNQWRQLVIEYSSDPFKGRPILDDFTMVNGVQTGGYGSERTEIGYQKRGKSYIVAKLWNPVELKTTGHCWRFHNFKPTSIGEIEMSHDSSDLTTFTVTGVFTHISYTNETNDGLLGFARGKIPDVNVRVSRKGKPGWKTDKDGMEEYKGDKTPGAFTKEQTGMEKYKGSKSPGVFDPSPHPTGMEKYAGDAKLPGYWTNAAAIPAEAPANAADIYDATSVLSSGTEQGPMIA